MCVCCTRLASIVFHCGWSPKIVVHKFEWRVSVNVVLGDYSLSLFELIGLVWLPSCSFITCRLRIWMCVCGFLLVALSIPAFILPIPFNWFAGTEIKMTKHWTNKMINWIRVALQRHLQAILIILIPWKRTFDHPTKSWRLIKRFGFRERTHWRFWVLYLFCYVFNNDVTTSTRWISIPDELMLI